MASIKNRKVSIQWKLNPDAFQLINKNVLFDITRRLGSSETAVNTMLMKEELLQLTMPILIGKNPTDDDWQKSISNYWNSLAVDIPENGKDLEIGFIFDLNDGNKIRKDYIKDLKLKSKITDSETLGNIVMSQIPEEEKYRYGIPISPADYLLWTYCQKYRDVANTVNDIDKSSYIRFYIHDNEIVQKEKEALVDLSIKAHERLIDIIKSNEADQKIYNILCVLEPTDILDIDKLDSKGRQVRLWDIFSKNVTQFINTADDKNLDTKALIERLLNKHILRKMPNTDVVVDVEDASIVLGNTVSEAVSWFALETNVAKISEYKIRLKATNNV